MILNFILFGIFTVAFVQGDGKDHFEKLKIAAEELSNKVLETLADVNNSPDVFDEYIKERSGPLLWEYTLQKRNFNRSITLAVTKGVFKKKQINNFLCISNGTRDTLDKLDETHSKIFADTEKIKRHANVTSFRFILSAFFDFVQNLYKTKEEEMKKTTDESTREKILNEFLKTMISATAILNQIKNHINAFRFKFFEIYGEYAFLTENKFKRIQWEGSNKILKCVS